MSGGVDSSVAAALLLQQGYDVTGAFMKQWSDTKELSGVCSWKEDRRDALRVAAKLGISLMTLDFEKEYNDWVVSYLFSEYEAGRTPNPDVMCNRYIKFGVWLDKARELDFDYLATGHYARVIQHDAAYYLEKAKDTEKDQTYFLHQVTQQQLAHVLFPIGEYTKPEVRTLAHDFDLPTAERAESMGICFIGEISINQFLQQKIKPQSGKVVLSNGTVLGEHQGLPFYTIGQRHIGVSGRKPLFVLAKKSDTNELVVGGEDDPLLYVRESHLLDTHWIAGIPPASVFDCEVRLRHRQPLQKACVEIGPQGVVTVQYASPQRAVTPGQFAVCYKGNQCLGGGIVS